MGTTRYLLAALALAGAVATGCGSSNGGSADSGTDGQGPGTDAKPTTDSPAPPHDGGKDSPTGLDSGPPPDGNPPPPPDGGDAGTCTFESYVTKLINTQTSATTNPDGTLGAGCPDTHVLIPINTLTP